MAERMPDAGAMTDAQLLARAWDWAGQAVEPVDADAMARAAATRAPLRSSVALRLSARGIPSSAVSWPAYGSVLLLVLLASLVAGALLVGSLHRDISEQRQPPPLWPARNGVIVVSVGFNEGNSPVVQVDPATGKTVTLRSGGWLVDPLFSSDGRQILFREQAGSWQRSSLWVMNADGSDARQLLPVGAYHAPAWAPAGDRVVVTDDAWLYVIDVASRTFVRHSLMSDVEGVSWRPNHEQILLSRELSEANEAYLVNADGTGLRSLPAAAAFGRWSPDGSTIAYTASTGRVDAQGRDIRRVRILEVDSGIDRELSFDGSDGTSEDVAAFSPDGTRLLIFRNTGNYPPSCGSQPVRFCWRSRPILVPVAGGGPEVVLGTFDAMSVPGEGGGAMFSPDGKQVLGMYGKEPKGVWLYDVDTGQEAAMTGPPSESEWWGVTWQRLAP